MRAPRFLLIPAAFCLLASAQTPVEVGGGSPTDQIRQLFQQAFYRNGFAYLVTLPPLANVRKVGTNGLVQEFSDAKGTPNVKLALVLPNSASVTYATSVLQMQPSLYSYWTSVGASTAGMPTQDTQSCLQLSVANSCQYQLFDKPYALFVYANLVNLTATNFATRDPYYTKWMAYGGMSTLGPANAAEAAVTSSTAVTATVQTFDRGAIYNYTTGLLSGKQIGVKEPVWDVYAANNTHVGPLGFPIGEELILPNGNRRQTFEKGAIDYDPATQVAVLRAAVATIGIIASSNPIRLKLGETAALKSVVADSNGTALTDRDVLWTSSDSRVASVQGSGLTAVVKANGGGTATIRATSEGKSSTAVTVVVTAVCCQVGEGAPTTAIGQTFQDAVTRNRLSVKVPAAAAVTRSGAGYVQQLEAADGGQVYWIAVSDRLGTGFLLGGRFLTAYIAQGGTSSSLGYPISDATAGGRQMFENGALAGDPVQMMTGDILAKWGSLGYETGSAGLPAGPATSFSTFRATRGLGQDFRGASLYAVGSGKVYAVSGLILARYGTTGGPGGRVGAPLNDEYGLNGRRRQDFEGGSIDYAPGDATAQLTESARQPVVTASPASAIAGTRVHLAVGGFNNGATVKVSLTGQSDFQVTVASGAYSWDAFVPADAKSGTVTVRAMDLSDATKSAQATYAIRATADAKLQLKVVRGDGQTGAPGAALPLPLAVSVVDDAGNAIPGVAVQFSASTGAKIDSSSATTGDNGEASAVLRLPANEGITLATARAAGQVVTFSARTGQVSLANFPKLSQAVDGTIAGTTTTIAQSGAMLTAVAAVLRYHQSRGELPVTNGLADVAGLNSYLTSFCLLAGDGNPVCDGYLTFGKTSDPVVNLWRVGGYVGNALDVSVAAAGLSVVRDLVSQGSPVMLALSLVSGQTPLGSHFAVATGIAADGSIRIMDPNPAFGRATLDEYLAGFTAGGTSIQATLTGVVRLLTRAPSATGFLVAANAVVDVNSPAGSCGKTLEFPPVATALAPTANAAVPMARLRFCDGLESAVYQLDVAGSGYEGTLTDLGNGINRAELSGSGSTSLKVLKQNQLWTAAAIDVSVASGGIVNAASFTTDIAPGGIVTVYGTGFGRSGSAVTAQISGTVATVLASFPFQVNLQIPPETAAGAATLELRSEFGTATQTIAVKAVAPALFRIGATRGAVINRDGSLNTPSNPARRGDVLVVFGTGFGSTSLKGGLVVVNGEVTATLDNAGLPVTFAGLTPGFVGLYQVNLDIPLAAPPGLNLGLAVKQGNFASNTVEVAVQ